MRIPISAPFLGKDELRNVSTTIRDGWISSRGRFIDEFEAHFSKFVGARFGVTTTSGTAALHLALATVGVGPGDEVILPDCTMIACLDAVLYTGATPVLVDVDPDTWTLDPAGVESAITTRTRVVMPVHLYGHPAEMDRIMALARAHDLTVIEDAAEAHGAQFRGIPVGGIGHIGCFSFYANKIITTGEGGMLVTRHPELARRARKLKDLAFMSKRRDYRHSEVAFNYRMTNIQAALGMAQLGSIQKFIDHRRECAKIYNEALGGVNGIVLPQEAPWAKSVYWMYTILVSRGERARRAVMRDLARSSVETRVAFWPLHKQPFGQCANPDSSMFAVSNRIGDCGLSLPSGNGISKSMVRRASRALLLEV